MTQDDGSDRGDDARRDEAPGEEVRGGARGDDAVAEQAADEDPHDTGLRELLSSALIAGPDPHVAEEVRAEPDPPGADDVAHAQAEEAVRRVYAEILQRAPEHDVQPTLDRVQQVCELLGDPQRAYPVIHLTGTNGKTSTARMVERLLRERGLRTGRFTSPHLNSVRERIALDGEPISPQAFLATWEDVAPYVAMVDERSQAAGGPPLSFFEVFTVMAFAAFADAPVDVAVVEVGMGGRWDATNVADGAVEVITPISRDHERWLGHTLTEITEEKVGIITERSTVVVGQQLEEVAGLITSAAAQHGARLVAAGQDLAVVDRQLAVGGQLLTLRTTAGTYTDVFLPLHGEHQAQNALLALAAVEAFFGGTALSGDVVEQGFAAVDSPARLELVRRSPTVLVDGAHNPAGAEALGTALEEAFGFSRLVGVVGLMADKDAEAVLSVLEPFVAEVVVTRATTDRAMDVDDLADVATDVFGEDRVHREPRLDHAIERAATLAESDPEDPVTTTGVIVTGSIILAAEARQLLGRGGQPL